MGHYSDASKEILAENDLPSTLTAKYGFGMIGVKRATFHRHLVEVAESHGVQIHWGHQLVSLEQGENDVTVTFKSGATDKASFVIGCDGLHSNTRIALFGEEQPQFTGLVQVSQSIYFTPRRVFNAPLPRQEDYPRHLLPSA